MRKKQYNRLLAQQRFGVQNRTSDLDTFKELVCANNFKIQIPHNSCQSIMHNKLVESICWILGVALFIAGSDSYKI